jgi:thymidine phosphorylase
MVVAQGGDPDAPLPRASHVETIVSERSGVVTRLDARPVGVGAWRLGAGRARKEDPVSPTAGVVCLARPGEEVRSGSPLFELHTDEPERFGRAREALAGALVIADELPPSGQLVIERVG